MNLNRILGWVAIIGLGAVIYSEYKKTQRQQVKIKR
jgi:hypothetical protein